MGRQIFVIKEPKKGEFHGCPFRDFPNEKIKSLLKQTPLQSNEATEINSSSGLEIEEVMEKKRNREYQLACRTLFERLHPNSCNSDDVGINPLGYFRSSKK